MSDVLEPALAPIRTVLRRLATRLDAKPTLRQGTVTSVGPVRVQLDGDTAPTPLTPRLLTPVTPGDRVTVAHTGRDLTIVGVVGGFTGPIALGATEHLNDLLMPGAWHQQSNGNASTARGYPTAQAGLLEVQRGRHRDTGEWIAYIYQRYQTNNNALYVRTHFNGTWFDWKRLDE